MQICERSGCTGCSACADACPQGCISIEYDENGFLHSRVDEQKCISCKRCIAVCPANNPQNTNTICSAYKFRRKDEQAVLTSTSGGAAALLAEEFVKNGGKVCGCGFDKESVLRHTLESDLLELEKFKGSKYVQSNTAGIYAQVKENLKKGEKVLFFGTPCQVSGLRSFLNKYNDGLYTVDLACHGVASSKILERYIQRCRQSGQQPEKITFRNKRQGYQDCNLNDFIIESEAAQQVTRHGTGIVLWFAAGISLRESCYKCSFASGQRCGDITLADYKGEPLTDEEKKYGVSAVFVSTEKGAQLLEMINQQAYIKESQLMQVLPLYSAFRQKGKCPPVRKAFFRDLNKLSLEQMEQKYTLKKILPNKLILYVKAALRRLHFIKNG